MNSAAARARRRAALAAVVAMIAGLAAPASATSKLLRHVPCERVAASPSFPADHVLFCAAATADKTGVDVYRSGDAGHTWAGPFPVERGQPHNDFAEALYLSPGYHSDHTLYVSTYDGPGYVSTDNGVTFTALAAAALISPLTATPFLDGEPGVVAARPDLIVASSSLAGCCDTIYDPTLPARPMAPGPPRFSSYYIVPPNYPATHQAVVLTRQTPQTQPALASAYGHSRAYGCAGEFVCATLLYDFAPLPGDNYNQIFLNAPTYPSGPDTYVALLSGHVGDLTHFRTEVYRSTDYGRTWAPWTSATKLLAPYQAGEEIFINASPDAPHRLFLRLAGGYNSSSIPDEQFYRSDDNGASWRPIGCAWGGEERPRYRCTLPFNELPLAYGATVVEPSGRLYLVGEHDTGKHVDYTGLYCSRDYGVRWSTNC